MENKESDHNGAQDKDDTSSYSSGRDDTPWTSQKVNINSGKCSYVNALTSSPSINARATDDDDDRYVNDGTRLSGHGATLGAEAPMYPEMAMMVARIGDETQAALQVHHDHMQTSLNAFGADQNAFFRHIQALMSNNNNQPTVYQNVSPWCSGNNSPKHLLEQEQLRHAQNNTPRHPLEQVQRRGELPHLRTQALPLPQRVEASAEGIAHEVPQFDPPPPPFDEHVDQVVQDGSAGYTDAEDRHQDERMVAYQMGHQGDSAKSLGTMDLADRDHKAGRRVSIGADVTNMLEVEMSHYDSTAKKNAAWTRASRLNRKSTMGTFQIWTELFKGHTRRQILTAMRVIIRRIVDNTWFDCFCGIMILINAALIGIETDHIATHSGETLPEFNMLSLALNSWYMFELMLRVIAYGKLFLFGADWRWNLFDVVLISSSVVDMATEHVNASGMGIGRVVRTTRLFRIVRVLRVVRMLRYVREFRKLVFSLASSIQTLFWSLLLLFFVIFCFGVFFCQSVSDHQGTREIPDPDLQADFGSMGATMYSLYLAITAGKNWGEILGPLMHVTWAATLAFLCFMSLCLFGLMNVITAVFVESAMQSSKFYRDVMVQEKLLAEQTAVKHIKEIFKVMDADNSGSICLAEMTEFLEADCCQIQTYFEALDLNATDTDTLFGLLDRDRSGNVDIEEFCDGCIRLRGNARSFDLNSLQHEHRRTATQSLQFMKYIVHRLRSDGLKRGKFESACNKQLSLTNEILKAAFGNVVANLDPTHTGPFTSNQAPSFNSNASGHSLKEANPAHLLSPTLRASCTVTSQVMDSAFVL